MQERKIKEWIQPGIFSGLQKISIPLFGVLSTALLAHKVLVKSDMGVWVNFLVITTIIEMFRSGIIKTSLAKYLNYSDKGTHLEIMSAGFFLNVLVSALAAVLLLLSAHQIEIFLKSPGLAIMLLYYTLTIIFLIFFSHFEWLMYAHSKFNGLFYIYLVRQGSTFLGFLFYYLITGNVSLLELVFIYTGGIIAGLITGYFLTKSILQLKFVFSLLWIKKLWDFGKYVFGTNIATLIFRNTDQMLLSNITGTPAVVASQNISMRIINIADIPSQVIGDILFPKSSSPELSERPERIKYYYERAVGASLSVIIPFVIVLLIFPKLLILILAGREYFDAIPYLRLISLSAIFLSFIKQWGVIIDSTGRPQMNLLVMIFLSAIQIGLCYFFISGFGLMGAAYGVLITHLLGFIITQILLNRFFNISILNCFKYCFFMYPEMYNIAIQRFKNSKRN